MAKIGRNSPCPCGSGLKHKKCCLSETPDHSLGLHDGDAGFGHDLDDDDDREPWQDEPGPEPVWKQDLLAKDTTESLVSRLDEQGIDASARTFRLDAAAVVGVWQLVDVWVARVRRRMQPAQVQWLEHAAWQLWMRYDTGKPCSEQLDAALERALALSQVGQEQGEDPAQVVSAALDACEAAWELSLTLLHPDVKSGVQAQDLLGLYWSPTSWLGFVAELIEGRDLQPGVELDRAVALVEAVLARLPGDRSPAQATGLCALAELLGRAGQVQRMASIAAQVIEGWPALSLGYLTATAALWKHPEWPTPALIQQVIGLQQAGLRRPVLDIGWDALQYGLAQANAQWLELGKGPFVPKPVPPEVAILQALVAPGDDYRRQALSDAVALGQPMARVLLRTLGDLQACPEAFNPDSFGHFYVIMLLGHLRVKAAHAPLLKLLRAPGPIEALLGDFAVEALPAVLFRTSGGIPVGTLALLSDGQAQVWARRAAAGALELSVAAGKLPREKLLERAADLLDAVTEPQEHELADLLVSVMWDLHPDRRRESLERAEDAGLVDDLFYPLDELDDHMAKGLHVALSELRGELRRIETEDVHAWLKGWACFRTEPGVRSARTSAPAAGAKKSKKSEERHVWKKPRGSNAPKPKKVKKKRRKT